MIESSCSLFFCGFFTECSTLKSDSTNQVRKTHKYFYLAFKNCNKMLYALWFAFRAIFVQLDLSTWHQEVCTAWWHTSTKDSLGQIKICLLSCNEYTTRIILSPTTHNSLRPGCLDKLTHLSRCKWHKKYQLILIHRFADKQESMWIRKAC